MSGPRPGPKPGPGSGPAPDLSERVEPELEGGDRQL